MGLRELKADSELHRKRLLSYASSAVDVRSELADNLWPYLGELVATIKQEIVDELEEQGQAIAEIIDAEGSVLLPDFAARLVGALELGKVLTQELEKRLADDENEVQRKRWLDIVHQYQRAAEVCVQEIADVTLEPEEVDEDGEGGPDDDGGETAPGEEEDEAGGDQTAAAE